MLIPENSHGFSSSKQQHRQLNAETVHQIWLSIIRCLLKNKDYIDYQQTLTIKELIDFTNDDDISKKYDFLTEESINKAIKENLINAVNFQSASEPTQNLSNGLSNENDKTLISLPIEKVSRLSHDWYCFECHGAFEEEQPISSCQQCWRIYHSESCISAAFDFTNELFDTDERHTQKNLNSSNFLCPICILSQKYSSYSIGSRHFNKQEFNGILGYTYTRFKAKSSHQISYSIINLKQQFPSFLDDENFFLSIINSKIISSSSINGTSNPESTCQLYKDILAQLGLYFLSFKSIDIGDIEEKLESCRYSSLGEFLGDCLTLKHTIELVVNCGAEQTSNSRKRNRDVLIRMLEVARYEMKEMIGCVDCYRNSNRQNDDKLWFCRPCDPPHELVFAKQKSYPFWPAKVIHPRNPAAIECCLQLDVRFFGGNHERSHIEKSYIKDINCSLAELNITKPMQSLEKALHELRTYRELLEKTEKSNKKKSKSSNESTKIINCIRKKSSCNRKTKKSHENRLDSDEEKSSESDSKLKRYLLKKVKDETTSKVTITKETDINLEDLMTEDEEQDEDENPTEIKSDDDNDDDDDEKEDIDEIEMNCDQENSKDSSLPGESTTSDRSKRSRGRPKKFDTSLPSGNHRLKSLKKNSSTSSNKLNNSILKRKRRKKLIFSPQSQLKNLNSSISMRSSEKKNSLEKRGRKPKFIDPFTPSNLSQSSVSSLEKSNNFNTELTFKNIASPKERINYISTDFPRSKSTSRSSKPRRSFIERERQIIQAQRKFMLRDPQTPKHIPPVKATKSMPTITTTTVSPIDVFNKVSKFKLNSSQFSNSLNTPINGISRNFFNSCQYLNNFVGNNIGPQFATKPQLSCITGQTSLNLNPLNDIKIEERITEELKQSPSSVLMPLNSEGETDNDEDYKNKVDQSLETVGTGEINGANGLDETKDSVPKPINSQEDDDDDDEEPYLYDDEQLEEQINDYLEYQKEKELEQQQMFRFQQHQVQQKQLSHYYQQQQQQQFLYQQQKLFLPNFSNHLPSKNHKSSVIDTKPANGFIDFPCSPVNYMEFSSSSVYVPTKKNQNLVNAYLHHVNTNKVPAYKTDFLAQYVLNREEFDNAEPQQEGPMSPRKRGRPPKTNDTSFEYSGKARCLLEKSYLQETSCNRNCLTNNVKAFKKFRDYFEIQNKNEMSKLKREMEELKQQVYRLKNRNTELEDEVKKESELNKRFNPAVLTQLEEKHQRQISSIKRKQWCVLCQAEASYFCCINTNYCSPQCQLKHWQSGHQLSCARNRAKILKSAVFNKAKLSLLKNNNKILINNNHNNGDTKRKLSKNISRKDLETSNDQRQQVEKTENMKINLEKNETKVIENQ